MVIDISKVSLTRGGSTDKNRNAKLLEILDAQGAKGNMLSTRNWSNLYHELEIDSMTNGTEIQDKLLQGNFNKYPASKVLAGYLEGVKVFASAKHFSVKDGAFVKRATKKVTP